MRLGCGIHHHRTIDNLLGLVDADARHVVDKILVVGASAAVREEIEPLVLHTAVDVYTSVVVRNIIGIHPVLSSVGIGTWLITILALLGGGHGTKAAVIREHIFSDEPRSGVTLDILLHTNAHDVRDRLVQCP